MASGIVNCTLRALAHLQISKARCWLTQSPGVLHDTSGCPLQMPVQKKKDMTGSTEANYLCMSIHENLWDFFISFFLNFHVIHSFPQAHLRRLTFWMKSTEWLWAGFRASIGREGSDRRNVPETEENHIGRKFSVGICSVLEGWQDFINISARSYKVWGFIKFPPSQETAHAYSNVCCCWQEAYLVGNVRRDEGRCI